MEKDAYFGRAMWQKKRKNKKKKKQIDSHNMVRTGLKICQGLLKRKGPYARHFFYTNDSFN